MKREQVKSKLIYSFLTLLLLITVVIGGRGVYPAYAATSGYSDVLTDLQKSEEFKVADYPDNPKDYAIKVIQIAESTAGELFIYTYQPCQKTTYLVATEINMSLNESADGTKLYGLTLLNTNGVFGKYKVEGVTVSTSATRYYNLTSIYRKYLKGIDEETGNDNEKNAIAFKVCKLYKVTTENGLVKYDLTESEVVTVTDKYVGFMRYTEGYWLWRDACDSHFIAFSTDWEIDYLYEAEVYYKSRNAEHKHTNYLVTKDDYRFGDEEANTVLLSEFDTGHTTVTGIGGIKHTWSRIQSVTKFKETESLSDEAATQLENKQWILRFADTEYSKHLNMSMATVIGYSEYYTDVSEVTILRLKFLKNSKVYNLGVVDNKQSGSDKPGNKDSGFDFLQGIADLLGIDLKKARVIFWVVVGVVAFVVLAVALTWFIRKIVSGRESSGRTKRISRGKARGKSKERGKR